MVRITVGAALVGLLLLWMWLAMLRMPGRSFSGTLPPLSDAEKALGERLRRDLGRLAGDIGERNVGRPRALGDAAALVERSLGDTGLAVERQTFRAGGVEVHNLEATVTGARSAEIVVVGAHYDSVVGSPGANDNGTGTVALFELARAFAGKRLSRTLRLVAFVNEEPPWFQSAEMGSWVYARRCRARGENIVAMLSLETIGYYSDGASSQKYPPPLGLFYPSVGNFIGFVGDTRSRSLVHEAIASFRSHARFPSEGAATFGWLPGVGWSDHWAFWQEGYPAIMVTDTAPYRDPYYHTGRDRPDHVDFDRLARVVAGLEHVVAELAGAQAPR